MPMTKRAPSGTPGAGSGTLRQAPGLRVLGKCITGTTAGHRNPAAIEGQRLAVVNVGNLAGNGNKAFAGYTNMQNAEFSMFAWFKRNAALV